MRYELSVVSSHVLREKEREGRYELSATSFVLRKKEREEGRAEVRRIRRILPGVL